MENKNFENINFPIIKNLSPKKISDSIQSIKPLLLEEAANGRIIKSYPYKYNTFASIEDLKNYIEDVIFNDKNLNAEWLETSTSISMPFNLRDDVYYTSVQVFSITCYKPSENVFDDIKYGKVICNLRPEDPLVSQVEKIIKELKDGH